MLSYRIIYGRMVNRWRRPSPKSKARPPSASTRKRLAPAPGVTSKLGRTRRRWPLRVAVTIPRPILAQPVRVLLAVAGVAIGVALAIHLANESVLASFRGGLGAVAGRATLQVTAGEAGFVEDLFLAVRGQPGIADATPRAPQP